MTTPSIRTRSLRSVRTQAWIPRLAVYTLVGILCLAGVRAIVAPRSRPSVTRTVVQRGTADLAVQAYAESFARAYLSWDSRHPEVRAQRLQPFGGSTLGEGAGATPADGTAQQVEWTDVVDAHPQGRRWIVTIAAQTTDGLQYLSVAVRRDAKGFLSLGGYPAFVGPPAATEDADAGARGVQVDDERLKTVIRRALGNYLGGAKSNLVADLAPDAVVSLPPQHLKLTDVNSVVWLQSRRSIACEVQVTDEQGSEWTLRYEVAVVMRDRWYVQSIEVNPTFKGGR
jgi:Conjugative transposon protein TcpC